jgi:hypothetical protein
VVLEDDCEFTDKFHYRYIFPEEADALYLGVSGFGIRPPGSIGTGKGIWKGVRFTRFGPNYLRVFNMLSGQARLYLTEAYREAVKDKATIYCAQGRRMDGVQASLHLSHVVLTPNEPACHQTPMLGGQCHGTCQSLLELVDHYTLVQRIEAGRLNRRSRSGSPFGQPRPAVCQSTEFTFRRLAR